MPKVPRQRLSDEQQQILDKLASGRRIFGPWPTYLSGRQSWVVRRWGANDGSRVAAGSVKALIDRGFLAVRPINPVFDEVVMVVSYSPTGRYMP